MTHKDDFRVLCPVCSLPIQDSDKLGNLQWKSIKMVKGLEHITCKKRLREQVLFSIRIK